MTDELRAGACASERAHDAGADAPAAARKRRMSAKRKRRMSAKRKQEAVLRLLRGEDLELVSRELGVTNQRPGAPRGPRAHDGKITTDRVDEMWGTDLTSVATGEGTAAVFIAVDHCSAECLGIHASHRATRHEALEPVRQAVRRSFGAVGRDVATGLRIRHDHGSQYMSGDFQKEVRFLGAESSPAFVREPEGNGCAERFIRTLKKNLLWVRWFKTIEELRQALLELQRTYNEEWIIQRHGYRTPAQVRQEQTATMQDAA